MAGGLSLGTAGLSNARAIIATTQLTAAGPHAIVARYGGDANYLAADSGAWAQTVEPAAPAPATATPVPALGPWGVLLCAVLTGWAGLRLRRVHGT